MNHSVEKRPEENVSLECGYPAAHEHFIAWKELLPVETSFHLQQGDKNESSYEEKRETTEKHVLELPFQGQEGYLSPVSPIMPAVAPARPVVIVMEC